MRRNVRTIGIVLETREDALSLGRPLEQLYHWREPEEIEAVTSALGALGFVPRLLGTPAQVARALDKVVAEVDFVFNISVGFVTRYRLALGPALYEVAGLPYSGADPYGKLVSQNKQLIYGLLQKVGIPVPDWQYCDTSRTHLCAPKPGYCDTNSNCHAWELCYTANHKCVAKAGNCNDNSDCESWEACNLNTHVCES